jgi:type I restriction enzyme M protein
MGSLKTQDIPVELRTWWKHFQVASYRHDYSRVFSDWVTMTLGQFIKSGFEQEHEEAMRAYDRKEKDAMNEMFFEFIMVFQQMVDKKDHPYYDALGHMYETLASQGKKSSLGQFFTPEPVIEVLVNQTLGDLKGQTGKRILDPACGSGRMLYVAHVFAPGNFQYGIDIDQLCAKMAAINMMMHGCVGEVVCGNGLYLENDWRFAFSINPILTHTGVPSIMKIEKDCSFIWSQYQADIARHRAEPKPVKPEKEKKKKVEEGQLTIF